MTTERMRVAIIGCGNIAGPYARSLITFPHLELVGTADIEPARAEKLAAEHGVRAYPTVEAALADPALDVAINLTIHHAHYDVTRQALEAGKHVFSEKPLALTFAEAQELAALARAKGLRLGAAPFTFLGEAQQTALRMIREGRLGRVRVAYAEVNWGRIETWHPNPAPFYAVGPLFDVGVYPLTLLTTAFGPARRVQSFGRVLYPDRRTLNDATFRPEAPDFAVTMLEWDDGAVARLTTNFYVSQGGKQGGLEFHGDGGSLFMASWQSFDSALQVSDFGQPYEDVSLPVTPYPGTEWGRGVAEMVEAIREGRPHRATGEQAAHVVEILTGAQTSMQTGGPVELTSAFVPPAPLPGWNENSGARLEK